MKNYLKHILLGLLISTQAFAGLPPTTATSQSEASKTVTFNLQAPSSQFTTTAAGTRLIETGNGNLLVNPSFEHSTYTTGWTVTNSTASKETSTILAGAGVNAMKLALSAQSGDLLVQNVTPTGKLTGINWQAGVAIATTLTTIQVCSLSGGVEVQCIPVPSTGNYTRITPTMLGSDGSTLGIKVKATSSSTGNVFVDDTYVGKSTGIGAFNQAQLWGAVLISGCASPFASTGTSFGAFGTQSGCTYTTYGNAQQPSSNLPAIKFASLPQGDFKLEGEGLFYQNVASKVGYFQFTDGTNNASEVSQVYSAGGSVGAPNISGRISYTTPQSSSVTFQIYGKTDSAGTVNIYGTSSEPLVIRVWYYPTAGSQVANPNTRPALWTGYHTTTSGNTGGWNTTSTTLTDPTNGSSITLNQGQNTGFPSVVTMSGSGMGITPTFPQLGVPYYICATVEAWETTSGHSTLVQLTDGSNTVISPQKSLTSPANNAPSQATLCGYYTPSTASPNIKVRLASDSGAVTAYVGSNFAGDAAISWSILQAAASFPNPILVGSIQSPSSGVEFHGRAVVTCGSSSTINSQGGAWLTSISNISGNRCTLTLATGITSGNLTCNASWAGTTTTAVVSANASVVSLTSVTLGCVSQTGGTTSACTGPDAFYVTCDGSK